MQNILHESEFEVVVVTEKNENQQKKKPRKRLVKSKKQDLKS
jgi:hypothetical protein|nr:MAG TPA: hypothetical protein [Bacteriophage sp.]